MAKGGQEGERDGGRAAVALRPAVDSSTQAPRRRFVGLFGREFNIADGAAMLMAGFLLSALLGTVRQVLFNAHFGAGGDANAYYAAFRLPDTLFNLIAGGALSGAMVPVLLGARRAGGTAAANRLIAQILTALTLAMVVLLIAGELFTGPFVKHLLVPGYDAGTQELTIRLTRIMLVQPLLLAAGSVAAGVLNSRSQFLLVALSVASHNIALIAGILVADANPQIGIYGPTLGVVGGALLQGAILSPGLLGRGVRVAWSPDDPRLREVGRLLIPNGLAVGVAYMGFIADTAFASRADDPASLAAIHNAYLLVGLSITLLGQAVGQAVFPRLALHATAGRYVLFRSTLLRSLSAAAGLALAAVVATVVIGPLAVRVVLQHGAFSSHDGALTSRLLLLYVIGLPAYVATEVLVRALVATRDARTPLFTNSVQLALRIALVALLLPALQAPAIPLAFAASATFEAAALFVLVLRRLAKLQARPAAI